MKSYDERDLGRDLNELAARIPVPAAPLRSRRRETSPITAVAATAAVVVLAIVVGQALSVWRGKAPVSSSGQPATASSSASATTSASANVVAPFVPFPDLTLLAGDMSGRIYKIRSGQTVGGPVKACAVGTVTAILPQPTGHLALVLCVTSGTAIGSAVLIDADGMAVLPKTQPVIGGRADAGAWSPDGRTVALLQSGPRTDVAEQHITLWDIPSGVARVVYPDHGLLSNLRWTSVGLTVSIPVPPDKGTSVWDGARWSHYSSRYLWLVDGSRALLVEAPFGNVGGAVWLRTGDQEQQLSPSDTEFPLGLDGDRAIVGTPNAIVVYHGPNKEVVPIPILCTGAQRSGRWLVCNNVGTGTLLLAYSLDARAPATENVPGLSGITSVAPMSE